MKRLLQIALVSSTIAITSMAQARDDVSWSITVGTPAPTYVRPSQHIYGPPAAYVVNNPRIYERRYMEPEVVYVRPAPRVTYIAPEPVITYIERRPSEYYRSYGPSWREQRHHHHGHGRWDR